MIQGAAVWRPVVMLSGFRFRKSETFFSGRWNVRIIFYGTGKYQELA